MRRQGRDEDRGSPTWTASGVGQGTSGTSIDVPAVGTPKLSGHQRRKKVRERKKKKKKGKKKEKRKKKKEKKKKKKKKERKKKREKERKKK